MLGRGDCGATAAAAAAAAAYLEAATAELFQGGRTDVDVVDVIAVAAGVIAAWGTINDSFRYEILTFGKPLHELNCRLASVLTRSMSLPLSLLLISLPIVSLYLSLSMLIS